MEGRFYRIGVDVGGTNTDAALLHEHTIIHTIKTTTTPDITSGIATALKELINQAGISSEQVISISIGTTQLLNALLAHDLAPVAVVRLASHASTSVPPLMEWPEELKREICGATQSEGIVEIVSGGLEYNGQAIDPINHAEIKEIAERAKQKRIRAFAITGLFSPLNPRQEWEVFQILSECYPDCLISLSHKLPHLGLLERENSNIFNAALLEKGLKVCREIFASIQNIHLHSKCKVFFSQNDGTVQLITNEQGLTENLPILTLNAAATNSFSSVTLLSKFTENTLVFDCGGSSTDIGVVRNGEVAEAQNVFPLVGVDCRFTSPASLSIPLGGGSKVVVVSNQVKILNESVSNDIENVSIIFGGDILTLTDIAVAKKRFSWGKEKYLIKLEQFSSIIDQADDLMHQTLASALFQVWSKYKDKPLHLVGLGGGVRLFDSEKLIKELSKLGVTIEYCRIEKHANVANAIGAALAKMSGNYVGLHFYTGTNETQRKIERNKSFTEAEQKATEAAIANGADSKSIKIKSKSEVELKYLPGNPHQITITAAGPVTQDYLLNQGPRTRGMLPQGYLPARKSASFPQALGRKKSIHTSLELEEQIKGRSTLLTEQQVADIACGGGFFSSGGGGHPKIPLLMAKYALAQGKNLEMISLAEIPDDAQVGLLSILGSPLILKEKLPSENGGVKIVEALKQHTGKAIDVLATFEAAGANIATHFSTAAKLGIPVVDADTMARAFPMLHQISIFINGDFGCDLSFVSLNDADNCERYFSKWASQHKKGDIVFVHHPASGWQACLLLNHEKAGNLEIHLITAESAFYPELAKINLSELEGYDATPIKQLLNTEILFEKRTRNIIPPCLFMSEGLETVKVQPPDAKSSSDLCLSTVIDLGGTAYIGMVIDGRTAKQLMIPGSLSLAEKIGRRHREACKTGQNPFTAVNEILSLTDYKQITPIFSGKVLDVERKETIGQNKGKVIIRSERNSILTIDFQNEYLRASFQQSGETSPRVLVEVPHLINIVCGNTFLYSQDVEIGQDVEVISLAAPAHLLTPQALKVVGPAAFPILQIESAAANRSGYHASPRTPNRAANADEEQLKAINVISPDGNLSH